jgi:hypothetical protein
VSFRPCAKARSLYDAAGRGMVTGHRTEARCGAEGGLSDKSFGPSRGAEPESKNLVDAAQPLIVALGFSLLRVFAVGEPWDDVSM